MKKILKSAFVTICATVLILFCGCALFQDAVTPCFIHPALRALVGLDDPLFMPYTTLFDARYAAAVLDFHQEFLRTGMAGSIEFRDTFFSPQGVGVLIPTSMSAIIAAFCGGAWIKRPQEKEKDKKIVELEKKVNGNNS